MLSEGRLTAVEVYIHDRPCLTSPSCMQAVGTRACYLFSRLVRSLRQNMRPLLSDILLRLQPHLAHILANPLPEAEPAAKGGLALCVIAELLRVMQPSHLGRLHPALRTKATVLCQTVIPLSLGSGLWDVAVTLEKTAPSF